MHRRSLFSIVFYTILGYSLATSTAQPALSDDGQHQAPTLTRLFFQDHETQIVRWVDVLDGDPPTLSKPQGVANFPDLEADHQQLVQMRCVKETLLVGIRDDNDGQTGSGWAVITSGITAEPHGDHDHWKYSDTPSVTQTQIDAEQGNPAHLYVYNGVFYLANDNKNGYTRFDPAHSSRSNKLDGVFHRGGGGHITLAVHQDIGFGTWIDAEGPNAGRVDITRLRTTGNNSIETSLTLPTGVIHGATAAADKVFFAPADGICWLHAREPLNKLPIHHIALGTDPESEKPLRTGAFHTYRDHVFFVTSRGDDALFGMLDARESEPKLKTMKLAGNPGTRPTTPTTVRTNLGKYYAFVFHDAISQDTTDENGKRVQETLDIIDLDPNRDKSWSDAKCVTSLVIGNSAVEGHQGHHSLACDASGRRAFIANPGDGTITIIRLDTLKPIATLSIGGSPEALIAVGAKESNH